MTFLTWLRPVLKPQKSIVIYFIDLQSSVENASYYLLKKKEGILRFPRQVEVAGRNSNLFWADLQRLKIFP
jgi:hypothetical protein